MVYPTEYFYADYSASSSEGSPSPYTPSFPASANTADPHTSTPYIADHSQQHNYAPWNVVDHTVNPTECYIPLHQADGYYTSQQAHYDYIPSHSHPDTKPISIPQVPPVAPPQNVYPQVYAPTPLSYDQPTVANFFAAQEQSPPQPLQWSYSTSVVENSVYPLEESVGPPQPFFHSSKPVQLIPTPTEMLIEATANNGAATNHPSLSCNVHMADRRVRRSVSMTDLPSSSSASLNPAAPAPQPLPLSSESSSVPDLSIPPSETISSHEKKRHYLECLEYYVLFLHQQLQLVGTTPVQMERVGGASSHQPYHYAGLVSASASSARGMNSRSIRTLLVHMKHKNRQLDEKINAEEQKFLTLRDLVAQREAASNH